MGFPKGDAMNWSIAIVALAMAVTARAGTLQEQIDAAVPGATITLPAGEYSGPIVITKPLTLRGNGMATIRGDRKTHVIHIKSDNVTVIGFHICGSGLELGKDHAAVFVEGNQAIVRENVVDDSLHGIYLKKVTDCELIGNRILGKTGGPATTEQIDAFKPGGGSDFCSTTTLSQNARGNGIHLWNCERITISANEIRDTRDGVYITFTNHSRITGNAVTHTRIGLHYMYSDYNFFESNSFAENSVGSAIMISKGLIVRHNTFAGNIGQRAYGVLLAEVDSTRFEDNAIIGNSIGVFMQLSNGNTFSGNTLARGYIGARLDGSSDENTFANNRFIGNMHPVEIDASLGRNTWSDGRTGNQWGNSVEVDLNGDGIGDIPHRETDLLGKLRRPFPLVALLSGSPALDLVGFAQQHASVPGVAAVVDPHPLVAGSSRKSEPVAREQNKSRPYLMQILNLLFHL
jgi:nitrous oxidase accessory protein